MENQKQNRFENSKIYKIVCNVTGLIYVGSTTLELNIRLSRHKSSYKRYLAGKHAYITSFKVLENDDFDIHLIRSYDFDNNIDLLSKERYYIEKLNCVNKMIPGRTGAEYYQYNKIEINADKNTVCVCHCNCTYTKRNKAKHQKTEKHIKLMAAIVPQIV